MYNAVAASNVIAERQIAVLWCSAWIVHTVIMQGEATAFTPSGNASSTTNLLTDGLSVCRHTYVNPSAVVYDSRRTTAEYYAFYMERPLLVILFA